MKIIPRNRWDLIILHPVCTAMAHSANAHYAAGKPRYQERLDAIKWTQGLWELAKQYSDRVALENPLSVVFQHLNGGKTSWVHPWQHGHPEQKKTGFHLWNLPPLEPTNDVYDYMMTLDKKDRQKVLSMGPSVHRKRDRSTTFPGIATAVVKQWGPLL